MNFGIRMNKNTIEKQSISQIRTWITKLLQIHTTNVILEGNIQILVNEVQCSEPNCVPIETLIVILESLNNNLKNDRTDVPISEGSRRWIGKVLKPLIDVNESDMMTLDLPIEWFKNNTSSEDNAHGDADKTAPNDYYYSSLCAELSRVVDQENGTLTLQQMREDLNQVLKTIEVKLAKKVTEDISTATTSSASITRVKMTSSSSSSKAELNADKVSALEGDSPATTTYISRNNVRVSLSDAATVQQDKAIISPTSSSPAFTNKSASSSIPIIPSVKESRPVVVRYTGEPAAPRHSKEKRQRGCPCCDPDSVENLIDKMIFLEYSPN